MGALSVTQSKLPPAPSVPVLSVALKELKSAGLNGDKLRIAYTRIEAAWYRSSLVVDEPVKGLKSVAVSDLPVSDQKLRPHNPFGHRAKKIINSDPAPKPTLLTLVGSTKPLED